MAAVENPSTQLIDTSMELRVASRALTDATEMLIESSREALESSRALLARTDRHMR